VIWFCHDKRYIKQTGSDFGMINGMENRQGFIMSCQAVCKAGRIWLLLNISRQFTTISK
jgi:hypothetical protein